VRNRRIDFSFEELTSILKNRLERRRRIDFVRLNSVGLGFRPLNSVGAKRIALKNCVVETMCVCVRERETEKEKMFMMEKKK